MAEPSWNLTHTELRTFLFTGVLQAISDERWSSNTHILATVTVKDEEGEVIHRKKCAKNGNQHVEEVLIDELKEQFDLGKLAKIELLSNYSPCDRCAPKLIQLKDKYPNLKIKIKCAHVYNVWPGNQYTEANLQGLWKMMRKGIQVQAFTDDDWLELLKAHDINVTRLSEASEELDYGHKANLIEWGREQANRTTQAALDKCNGRVAATVSEIHDLYERANTEAIRMRQELEEEIESTPVKRAKK